MADKINIELDDYERDLLLKFSNQFLCQNIVHKISKAKKRGDYYTVSFSHHEVEYLVGDISFIINHSDDDEESDIIFELNDLAERFESYI